MVLLDIGLPTLNGIEVAKRISKVSHGSKVIVLAMESNADVVRVAFEQRSASIRPEKLMLLLNFCLLFNALRGERFVSSGLRE